MDDQDLRYKEFDKVLDFLEQNRLFSGVVLLSEEGIPFYNRAIGRRTATELHTQDSVFEIASISKSFTAMAIMILMEEGKLNLEDDLITYFPDLPYKNITIKNMLTHTSGLPDYMEWFETEGNWDIERIATNKDVVAFLKEEEPDVLFPADDKWEYCNTGYVLLAEIIEKVSRMEYGTFLKTKLFKPLNMENTTTHSHYLDGNLTTLSQGYIYDWKQDLYKLPEEMEEHKYVYFLDGVKGDGGIKSTVLDLLKWERSLYRNVLVSKKTMESVINPVSKKNSQKSIEYCHGLHEQLGGYGFGWKIEDHPHYKKLILHDGYWAGYCSGLISYKDYDKSIIMLTNLDFTDDKFNKVPHLLTLLLENILFGGKADLKEFEDLILSTHVGK
ncbi:serine hydrolase domain-containing protein [Alkalihalobacillus sp. CinArs1]|uniref:serine hydrolase domain-containing protein n=1 Tax=Alkalihalobacillus sp. CinArs1 TaxID=2995314 RepID=UPI0022DDC271|nr:serine hydrolase domain-containing protein [Alkalihalobacillus sp. CinArs1]